MIKDLISNLRKKDVKTISRDPLCTETRCTPAVNRKGDLQRGKTAPVLPSIFLLRTLYEN